eukprot:SAG11_NODE_2625_length_3164_cov_3.186623_5_plen_62_part_00
MKSHVAYTVSKTSHLATTASDKAAYKEAAKTAYVKMKREVNQIHSVLRIPIAATASKLRHC